MSRTYLVTGGAGFIGSHLTEALLARALVDPRTDGAERLVLARAERSLVYLRRLEAPFLALGDEVLAAHTGARPAEALALSLRVNKVYGTTVILAEETHRLAQHAIEARELDVVIVAGRASPSGSSSWWAARARSRPPCSS